MGGNHKGGLSVLWMPRKKKHHHHNKRQDNVFKSGKGRPINFGVPGPATGSPGLLGESRPAVPLEKPVDIKLLHLNNVSATVDNPSTSAKEDHNAIENDAADNSKASETNDDEYLEKSEDTTDTVNLKNDKDDNDVDEKPGLGFECMYCVFHCCDCTIS
ncbi:uncharacterized protein LOC143922723 [Arctopsyche grandis]|uniref:uncharacterized protein LOC143922723 n=1 Tax=Arctopsyche grandis TaxID=121162 RepID=UPI00406D91C3